MRTLITGGTGFLGRHLALELRSRGHEVAIAGGADDRERDVIPVEIVDFHSVERLLAHTRPDVVYHLAGQASVARSLREPAETFEVNALGTLRLFEAARLASEAAKPRVILASSAEVYGARTTEDLPFVETLGPQPVTPYAASKVAAEAIALASFRSYGVPAIVCRNFNTIGPGQDRRFAVPSFAHQLAAIARGGDPVMLVGNLNVSRDFLDVRDVVTALADVGERGAPGEIYNICSGKATTVQEVLRLLITLARVPVEVREDPARVRGVDAPAIYGDNRKIREATGWQPRVALAASLRDTLNAALAEAAAPAP